MILIGCTVIDQTETSYSISIGQSFWLLYSQMDEVCERNNFSITIQHFCEFSQKQRALDFINSVSGFVSKETKIHLQPFQPWQTFPKKIWHLCKNPQLPLWFFSFWGVVGLARFFACCNHVLTDFELQTKKQFWNRYRFINGYRYKKHGIILQP